MNKPLMIIDGQWGSTGKGLIAGYLSLKERPDAVVCNFGPNAGHTFVSKQLGKVVSRLLPTSGVISPSVKYIFIGPGAVLDLDVLKAELAEYAGLLGGKTILIHERTAVISHRHKEKEAESLKRIASTQKGTGAAMAAKVMRELDAVADEWRDHITACSPHHSVRVVVVSGEAYLNELERHISTGKLIIESAQGLELGLNSGSHYPFCTGRDVTPNQILSDCGIPFLLFDMHTVVTMRTFPIRVGNEFKDGAQVGYSGDVYPDQREITYDEIEVDVETTTVTGKPRRIFTWSERNYRKMLRYVKPDWMFLNFVNYLSKERPIDFSTREVGQMVRCLEDVTERTLVRWIGTGPDVTDIIERDKYRWR